MKHGQEWKFSHHKAHYKKVSHLLIDWKLQSIITGPTGSADKKMAKERVETQRAFLKWGTLMMVESAKRLVFMGPTVATQAINANPAGTCGESAGPMGGTTKTLGA